MGKSNNYKTRNSAGKGREAGEINDSKPNSTSTRSSRSSASTKKERSGQSGQNGRGRGGNPSRSGYVLASYDQLLRDAGTLSFSYATGLPYKVEDAIPELGSAGAEMTVPGIMALNFTPTVGYNPQVDTASSINVCAKALYAKMWSKRTGATTAYDPADVMLYAIALSNIAMFHAHLRRAYGVARTYSVENRYKPLALLKAMGFNATSIVNNLPELRSVLNNMAFAMSSFAIPKGIPILNSWIEMVDSVYTDGESEKSQLYVYVPENIYTLAEDMSELGLELTPLGQGSNNNVTSIKTFVQKMLDRLLSSQDLAAISGDILRTFDDITPYQLPLTDDDYRIDPVYDPITLVQIANTTMVDYVGDLAQDIDGNISQAVGIERGKAGGTSVASSVNNLILNFPSAEVTPEMVFLATRGTSIATEFEFEGDDANTYRACFSGSYVVTSVNIWIDPETSVVYDGYTPIFYADSNASQGMFTGEVDRMRAILYMTNFAFHPYVGFFIQGSGASKEYIYMGDIHNFTMVNAKELHAINTVYMNAQFGLPYNV